MPAEWIDYIGHMMDAYYFVAFTEATEAFLDHLGLGERYRTGSGCGMYTVESHLCFSKSVRAGAVLAYDSQLLGWDEKRLHVFHRMSQSPSGEVVATNELMFLHVDIASERVTRDAVRSAATPPPGLPPPMPRWPGPPARAGASS